uniref:Uncharacterized protein n=1 Tax=Sphaerodactylus townsendi TaxID=933632 RepID=A0ACB8EYR6_9SAUR
MASFMSKKSKLALLANTYLKSHSSMNSRENIYDYIRIDCDASYHCPEISWGLVLHVQQVVTDILTGSKSEGRIEALIAPEFRYNLAM